MSLSEAEIETILEELRGGATVQRGGSRCHTTYYYRDGQWGFEDFDEGYSEERPTTEAVIRELIAGDRALFVDLLARPHWRRLRAAFFAGERDVAREALRSAVAYGDPHDHGKVLDAVLAWPDAAPTEEVAALIRSKLDGFTAYHVFMQAAGWDRSAAVGARGVEFAERLLAMVGPALGSHYLRATFHEQAGDLAAAERDLLEELARTPAGAWQRGPFQEALERLRGGGRG